MLTTWLTYEIIRFLLATAVSEDDWRFGDEHHPAEQGGTRQHSEYPAPFLLKQNIF